MINSSSITKKSSISFLSKENIFWFHFFFENNNKFDSALFIDLELPNPTIVNHSSHGFRYAWAIDGYFATASGKQYMRDIKDRLTAMFAYHKIPYQDISWVEPSFNNQSYVYEKIYNLSDFDIEDHRTKTLKQKWKKELDVVLYANTGNSLIDKLFEAVRYEVYALKRENRLSYENTFAIVERANNEIFHDKYTYSDIKAKAKAMYEWTLEYYIGGGGNRREYHRYYMREKRKNERQGDYVNRQQSAENARILKSDITRKKVLSAVAILRGNGILYKKNRKINISLVAETANVNRRSAKKYIEIKG